MTGTERTAAPQRNWLAGVGLACGLVGAVGYFALVVALGHRLPWLRDRPWPDLVLVAVGLACSVVAVRRAWRRPATHRGRVLAPVLGGVNLVLASVFVWYLSAYSTVSPPAGVRVGTAAPAFALPDQSGTTRRLADYRGAPLLLVFYRGHW